MDNVFYKTPLFEDEWREIMSNFHLYT